MNLEYKMLWIDDHPKQVESAKQFVLERLARKGFQLKVQFLNNVKTAESLKSHFSSDYDLLAIDFQMSNGSINGDQIVKAIRSYCPLTEIVFYSSSPTQELKEKMLSQKIMVDGVYYANRKDLHERLNNVIDTTIKKTFDLNQMRGLFLSCVADFDHTIDELITHAFNRLESDEKRDEIKAKIKDTAMSHHVSSKERLENISNNEGIDVFLDMLTSDPKHKVLHGLLYDSNDDDLNAFCVRISNYTTEIIHPRNKLAHYMKKEARDGKYTLISKNKEFTFDDIQFQGLRHKLLEYRDVFDQLMNNISVKN